MINYLFCIMIAASFIYAIPSGNLKEVTDAVLNAGQGATQLCLQIFGTLILWSGIMKIASRSGLCEAASKLLYPITGILFKGLKQKSPEALNFITMNITANLLGLGSAATPMGLAAMGSLDKINDTPDKASDYMITFVVMNTASIQLLPTTVATFRTLASSKDPLEIAVPVIVTSFCSVFVAVFVAKVINKISAKSKKL